MKKILLLVVSVVLLTIPVFSQNYMIVHKSDGNVMEIQISEMDSVSFVYKQPSNEIWYTTTNEKIFEISNPDIFAAGIVSNTYQDGKGVIRFDTTLTRIGDRNTYFRYDDRNHPFDRISTLKSIDIPESVEFICSGAFFNCSNLRTIKLPKHLKYMGAEAIFSCGVEELSFPVVDELADKPIMNCRFLRSISGPYASKDGRCLIKDKKLYAFAPSGITDYSLPEGVEELGIEAFYSMSNIQKITLPKSLKKIGVHCFGYCYGLKEISIPDSVIYIGDAAFSDCSSLSSTINIPEGAELDWEIFIGCTSLSKFTGKYATEDGRCLVRDGVVMAFAPAGLSTYSFPEGVNGIKLAISSANVDSLVIPSTVTWLYEYIRGNTVKSITCLSQTPPVFQSGRISAPNLEVIYVPAESVETYKTADVWSTHASKIKGLPSNQPNNEIWYTSTDGSVVTPKNTNAFGATLVSNTYVNGKGILKFSDVISMIGDGAFEECSNLSTVVMPTSVLRIGRSAFWKCSGLTSLQIPSNVLVIEDFAFSRCSGLTSLNIPENVSSIGSWSFSSCSGLKTITVDPNNKDYDSRNSCNAIIHTSTNTLVSGCIETIIPSGILIIGDHAFYGQEDLISMTIPDGVTTIGGSAFSECHNMESVVIPESVTSIQRYAFDNCKKLGSIYLPSGMTTIAEGILSGCACLKTITVPRGVSKIERIAFNRCSGLTEITFMSVVPPTISEESILGNTNNCPIYVPEGSVNAYKTAENWSEYADRIQGIPEERPDNEIWYTSTDGEIVTPNNLSSFGKTMVSNIYKDGKGVMAFDGPLTVIGTSAFTGCSTLETIIHIGNTVKTLGWSSFSGCSNLTSVVLPSSLESIGTYSFYHCKLKKIEFPSTLKTIGFGAFENCLLDTVTIPESIVSIENGAFDQTFSTPIKAFYGKGASSDHLCLIINETVVAVARNNEHLDFVIPEGVKYVGSSAFYFSQYRSVTIPESLIDCDYGFASTRYLSAFYGAHTSSDHRCLIIDGKLKAFADYGLTSYDLTEPVTVIDNHAFYNQNSSLKELILPNTVDSIGESIISLTPIERIVLPSSLKIIAQDAFFAAYSLKELTIPASVEYIGTEAFSYAGDKNGGLSSITFLSENPPVIEDDTFDKIIGDCPFYVPAASVEKYKTAENWSVYSDRIQAITGSVPDDAQPNDEIWYTSTDGEIVIPYNGNDFGSTLISNTYSDGKGILKFESSVTGLGYMAFGGCRTLSSVSVPASVETVGVYVFRSCPNLDSIRVAAGNTVYDSRNNCNAIIETATNKLIAGCNNTVIPSDISCIDQLAFFDYPNLKTVVIPESVTSIGMAAFAGCCGLTSISVAAGNTVYDSRNNCNAIIETATNKLIAGCDISVIPADVSSIDVYAFANCGFTSLNIPEGVTSIAAGAFTGCSRLSSMNLPQAITVIEDLTFGDCSSLTSIIIPEGVTTIGEHAFSRSGLTSIDIPIGVRRIGFDAFGQCSNLESVTFSDNVVTIDDYAFRYCPKLTSVVIPASIDSIGVDAFYGCSSLENVEILSTTPPVIGHDAFGYNENYPIYVPASSVLAYKNSDNWKVYTERIQAISDEQPNNEIWYTSTDGGIVIPSNVDRFGANLVSNTYEDGKGILRFDGDVTMVGDERLGSSSDAPFCYVYNLKTIKFPESVRKVGNTVIYNCFNLEDIQLPSHLDFLGSAFEGTAIKKLYVPETDSICSGVCHYNLSLSAFEGPYASLDGRCLIKNARVVSFAPAGLTSYTIPDGVQTIGFYSFAFCDSILSYTIPEGVSVIEYSAFLGCRELVSIVISESVKRIDDSAFSSCFKLTEAYIPDNAEISDYGIFGGCNSMVHFSGRYASEDGRCLIKDGTIVDFASAGLVEYSFPVGIEKINYCYTGELERVIFPSSINSIYYLQCDSARAITCHATSPINLSCIGYCPNLEAIYVPAESVDAYKTAACWSEYADRIQAIP